MEARESAGGMGSVPVYRVSGVEVSEHVEYLPNDEHSGASTHISPASKRLRTTTILPWSYRSSSNVAAIVARKLFWQDFEFFEPFFFGFSSLLVEKESHMVGESSIFVYEGR